MCQVLEVKQAQREVSARGGETDRYTEELREDGGWHDSTEEARSPEDGFPGKPGGSRAGVWRRGFLADGPVSAKALGYVKSRSEPSVTRGGRGGWQEEP